MILAVVVTINAAVLDLLEIHPLEYGQVFCSPGAHFSYRVIGPCCRLFDREQLPWPCCRIQWGGKEPSWRRIGKRFVVDLATRNHPSYCVEIVGQGEGEAPFVLTLYSVNLSPALQEWWHSKKLVDKIRSTTLCSTVGVAEDANTEG